MTIRFATSWASQASGATATGDVTPITAGDTVLFDAAAPLRRLIDDTEDTNWQAAAARSETPGALDGAVTIDLGEDSLKRIEVQVSAALTPCSTRDAHQPDLTQNRFTALRQFEIWACNKTGSTTCAEDDDFTRVYASPADFSRPTLRGRSSRADPARVRHPADGRDAPPRVRPDEPVHGWPAVPGRAGQRSVQRHRLRYARPGLARFVRIAEVRRSPATPRSSPAPAPA